VVPKKRSNIKNTSATVITGNAVTMMIWVTRVIQVKTGSRIIRMPGARRLMMVTRKLNPAAREAMPSTWSPTTQKSMLSPGEYCREVRFTYPNHPPSGAAPTKKLAFRNKPPRRNTQ